MTAKGTEPNVYIGIDPGLDGGIAILSPCPKMVVSGAWVMPTIETGRGRDIDRKTIREMLNAFSRPRYAAIEKVNAAPMRGRRQGTTSMFNFGRGYGVWLGILEALGIPFIEVTPQRWKRVVLKGFGTDKQAAIRYVKRFHPERNLRRTPRCTTDHDGMADALCIAEYGRRTWEESFLATTAGNLRRLEAKP